MPPKRLVRQPSQTNCNDHVLKEQEKKNSYIMIFFFFFEDSVDAHPGMCVGLCVLDAHQSHIQGSRLGPAITVTVGRLL